MDGPTLIDAVLGWSYLELRQRMSGGKGWINELPKIPTQFGSIEEYVRVFEPLLLEECAAQLMRGQEEGQVFLPERALITHHSRQADAGVLVTLVVSPGVSSGFSENDCLLLSQEHPGADAADMRLHALGVVQGHEGDLGLKVRFKLSGDAQAGDEKGSSRVKAMQAALAKVDSQWWVLKLSSLSTIMREWAAVHSIAHTPLRDVLLTAKPARSLLEHGKLEVPPRMRSAMEGTYNESQMKAVTAGLDGSQVVLVQGPPGTGKTKTILGLLSIVMHSAPRGAFASAAPAPSMVSPASKVAKTSGMTSAGRQSSWLAACPWLTSQPDARNVVVPPDEANSDNAFGYLQKSIPRRIGRGGGPKARVLVCAPSNSALDEIVHRLITLGLTDQEGHVFTPNVVRVGVSIHHSVQSVALDTLVQHRLGRDSSSKGGNVTRHEQDRLRMSILEEANIVCTTLAFSGGSSFTRLVRKFDVVIIDEAAQAVEPSTLVPLAHGGAKQVYLVGDPVQLPATVMSQRALAHGYSDSLFKRLQRANYPVNVLDTQYRMHPAIREFPSKHFYGGSLKDGAQVEAETARPWHACPAFRPLVFLDVSGKESTPQGSSSLVNRAEAEVVLSTYRELIHRFPELKARPAVGVISPYKAQVSLLQETFRAALGADMGKMVDINTIDGFQGREKEVVIFSTVRSSQGKTIGFVADERRINVGLTRGRCSLIVVGNAEALQANPRWSALVVHARKAHCLFRAQKPYSLFPGTVADGAVVAEEPTPQDLQAFVPEAEPGVYDDEDDYSD